MITAVKGKVSIRGDIPEIIADFVTTTITVHEALAEEIDGDAKKLMTDMFDVAMKHELTRDDIKNFVAALLEMI